MPHDLFGDVFVRPPSARRHRSSLVVLSILGHGAMLAALIVVPLIATDTLPIPQRAFQFVVARHVMPTVPDPPRARPATRSAGPIATSLASPSVPLSAPNGIPPETGLEGATPAGSVGPPQIGAVEGIGTSAIGAIEPPAPPPPMAPLRLHRGIREPQKIVDVAPAYPAAARAARIEGIVIIEATIDVRGRVETAQVLRHVPLLDQAALDAVKQWTFMPALLNGVPVPVIMNVTVRFSLR